MSADLWRKLSVFVLFSKKEIKKGWADTSASPPSSPSSSSLRSLYWPAAFCRQMMFKSSGCFCYYLWMHSRLKTMSWWCCFLPHGMVTYFSWQSFHVFLINADSLKAFLISNLENKQLWWTQVSHSRRGGLRLQEYDVRGLKKDFFLSLLIGKNVLAPTPQKDELSLLNGCLGSDWGFLQSSITTDCYLCCLPLVFTSFRIRSSQSSSNSALHKSLQVSYFALCASLARLTPPL